MERFFIIFIGAVVAAVCLVGFFFFRKIHEVMFGNNRMFANSPPEFLWLPMGGGVGIGALFVFYGIFAY